MGRRHLIFASLLALTLAVFLEPASALVRLSFQSDYYSHIVLVPLMSAGLIYWKRRTVFSQVGTDVRWGGLLLAAGVGFFPLAHAPVGPEESLALTVLSLVTFWMAGFALCYGREAFRMSAFPLLFLLLMVPLPGPVLDKAVHLLQQGSAEVAYGVFRLTGVPVFREGFVFSLPGVTIEVAKECSGIRSSLALFITSLLAGYLFLRSGWNRVVLGAAVLPVLIVKNGLRIVTLTLLAVYVDRSFLSGSLHRYGGMVFFALALALLGPLLLYLQRSEDKEVKKRKTQKPAGVSVRLSVAEERAKALDEFPQS